MATCIHIPNMREGYITLVDTVSKLGYQRAPRGLPTVELTDFTFVVDDLLDTLPVGIGRDLNTQIAAAESLQLIAGDVAPPETMVKISSFFANSREPEGHFHGAYGRRIGDQAEHVLTKIKNDPDTRQAIITLWDPTLDNQPGKRDYPCTVALGFRYRNGHLDMSVTMRSNDVWLGTAYDVFQFVQLQWTLARALEITPGTYTHTAWSFHIYERDLPRAARLEVTSVGNVMQPVNGLGFGGVDFQKTRNRARDLLLHPGAFEDHELSGEERWYVNRMRRAYTTE